MLGVLVPSQLSPLFALLGTLHPIHLHRGRHALAHEAHDLYLALLTVRKFSSEWLVTHSGGS